jgi:hypothetical protein
MGSSSFALKLHEPETAHSEGIETEGNIGRQDLFSLKLFPKKSFNNMFSETHLPCLLIGKTP